MSVPKHSAAEQLINPNTSSQETALDIDTLERMHRDLLRRRIQATRELGASAAQLDSLRCELRARIQQAQERLERKRAAATEGIAQLIEPRRFAIDRFYEEWRREDERRRGPDLDSLAQSLRDIGLDTMAVELEKQRALWREELSRNLLEEDYENHEFAEMRRMARQRIREYTLQRTRDLNSIVAQLDIRLRNVVEELLNVYTRGERQQWRRARIDSLRRTAEGGVEGDEPDLVFMQRSVAAQIRLSQRHSATRQQWEAIYQELRPFSERLPELETLRLVQNSSEDVTREQELLTRVDALLALTGLSPEQAQLQSDLNNAQSSVNLHRSFFGDAVTQLENIRSAMSNLFPHLEELAERAHVFEEDLNDVRSRATQLAKGAGDLLKAKKEVVKKLSAVLESRANELEGGLRSQGN